MHKITTGFVNAEDIIGRICKYWSHASLS